MSPKSFLVVLFVTAVTVAAAVAVILERPGSQQAQSYDAPVFPLLQERINDVAKLEIQTAEESITLAKVDDRWTLPGTHGYPAREKIVREVVLGLRDLKVAEAKSRRPEGFARLEVEDLEAEDAKSRLVKLSAADGTLLAEALLGRQRQGTVGEAIGGTYYRKPGGDQAWLAAGTLSLPKRERAWLQTDVVHLAAETVAMLEVEHADGSRFRAARDTAEAETFELEPLPEGRSADSSKTKDFGSSLTFVAFTEVAPADQVDFAAEANRAVVTTFDGVAVTVELGEADGDLWAKLSAELSDEAPTEGEAREAAEKLAGEISGRTEGWAYRLDDHVIKRLLPKVEEFLAPEPKEAS